MKMILVGSNCPKTENCVAMFVLVSLGTCCYIDS